MALRTMEAIIRIRRGTYNQWYNSNPLLKEGEISYVTSGQDNGKFKVGDGTTLWRNLPYNAARFPEDSLTLADSTASNTLPLTGTIKELFQSIRNFLKWTKGLFDPSAGHKHNGTDSPKISYNNLTDTNVITDYVNTKVNQEAEARDYQVRRLDGEVARLDGEVVRLDGEVVRLDGRIDAKAGFTRASSQDLNTLRTKGFYSGTFSNYPSGAGTNYGSCIVQETTWGSTTYVNQIYIPEGNDKDIYWRTTGSSTTWGAWKNAGNSSGGITLNRTVQAIDSGFNANTGTVITDTGGNLSIPIAVDFLEPSVGYSTLLTTGKYTLRFVIDYITRNIKWLFNNYWQYPIGKLYIQLPSEPTPAQAELPGQWVPWNTRPVIYGLSTSYPTTSAYSPTATAAVAAGAFRTVTHDDGDVVIYQLINAKPAGEAFGPFDPVKWRPISDPAVSSSYRAIFRARNAISGHSFSSDLAIGANVTAPNDANPPVNMVYSVTAVHSLGGKFLSGAGGNRPPFETGGVHGDAIRAITGYFESLNQNANAGGIIMIGRESGPFNSYDTGVAAGTLAGAAVSYGIVRTNFESGRVVPKANENTPRAISVTY